MVQGSGRLCRMAVVVALLSVALGGATTLASAAQEGPEGRALTCFGERPTRRGTAADDTIYGTNGDDVIVGRGGNDIIWGRGGNDLICGNEGVDFLFGGMGRDSMQGGPGYDILYGEEGRDTLLGGPGGNILNGGLSIDRCLDGETFVSCELPSADKILAECPTPAEIARIDAEFDLIFDASPTPSRSACTPAGGSAYLSPLEKRAYNALLLMARIPFDAPLPWTALTLEDWFAQNVTTIWFRDDIAHSQYGPAGVINIQTGWPLPASQATDRFVAADGPVGLGDLIVLMVHEARHAEKLHTCGWVDEVVGFTLDNTIGELGAWGVQYYLHRWLAEHTSPAFLRPLTGDPGRYQAQHAQDAVLVENTRFCSEP